VALKPLLRAVLFDAAGTLIRLREPVGETYTRFAREHGVVIPASQLDDAFARVLRGMPTMVYPGANAEEIRSRERGWWRELVRRTLRAADGSARLRDFESYFDALFALYAGPDAWAAAPGAAETLGALAERGLRLAIVSNFDHRLPALLEALGLDRHLAQIVLPGRAGAAKPDARIFAVALAALDVTAAEAVYVGDDPVDDHDGARAAGLRAVDVRALATLASLPALLERLESPA
jgi:putative hydrolase of the HAD superfamily